MRKWGYHASEEARIFDVGDDGRLPSGWHDSPAAIPTGADVVRADSIADLTKAAEALGIEIDGRWGANRLKREIRKAKG